jgi:hypothetical protein
VTAVWLMLAAGWLFVACLGGWLVGTGVRIANEIDHMACDYRVELPADFLEELAE